MGVLQDGVFAWRNSGVNMGCSGNMGNKGNIFQHIIWSEERQVYFGMKEERIRF